MEKATSHSSSRPIWVTQNSICKHLLRGRAARAQHDRGKFQAQTFMRSLSNKLCWHQSGLSFTLLVQIGRGRQELTGDGAGAAGEGFVR